jgi:hypothetical protein
MIPFSCKRQATPESSSFKTLATGIATGAEDCGQPAFTVI